MMNKQDNSILNFAEISKIDDNIIHIKFTDTSVLNLERAIALDNKRLVLCNSKPYYSIIDLKDVFGNVSKRSQYYLGQQCKSTDLIVHEVIIANSLPVRMLVNYYIKIINPKFKIEVFKDFESGLAFLKQKITA